METFVEQYMSGGSFSDIHSWKEAEQDLSFTSMMGFTNSQLLLYNEGKLDILEQELSQIRLSIIQNLVEEVIHRNLGIDVDFDVHVKQKLYETKKDVQFEHVDCYVFEPTSKSYKSNIYIPYLLDLVLPQVEISFDVCYIPLGHKNEIELTVNYRLPNSNIVYFISIDSETEEIEIKNVTVDGKNLVPDESLGFNLHVSELSKVSFKN